MHKWAKGFRCKNACLAIYFELRLIFMLCMSRPERPRVARSVVVLRSEEGRAPPRGRVTLAGPRAQSRSTRPEGPRNQHS